MRRPLAKGPVQISATVNTVERRLVCKKRFYVVYLVLVGLLGKLNVQSKIAGELKGTVLRPVDSDCGHLRSRYTYNDVLSSLEGF